MTIDKIIDLSYKTSFNKKNKLEMAMTTLKTCSD